MELTENKMSVDYEIFMEGLRDKYTHLQEVFDGTSQEEQKDHTYLVLAFLPVILNSRVSGEMRSLALREYTEMYGALRDSSLGLLNRNDFYKHARDTSAKEAVRSDDLRAQSAKKFQVLKEYLSEEEQTTITETEAEYELFKSQLSLVIKSDLGIPEDQVVGPKEVNEYLARQRSINN